jgi:oligopeptide/dipeptide ABC transporter ATP-binding protein
MIQATKLSVHFDARFSQGPTGGVTKAIDRVDLEIRRGEIFSLVGESGSGKTTLGRAIAGLIKPTDGVVKIDGEAIKYRGWGNLQKLWRRCQMIFQDPYSSFPPLSTVIETLQVPLIKYGIAKNPAAIREALGKTLQEVGLKYEEIVGKYPRELSGGQRQRASITRAMLVRPEILIADEPISMLDVSSRIGILSLLRNLNHEHSLTVLFITHDLGAAEYLGGRIGVMYKGQIMEIAEPAELLQNPSHPYTRVLLKAAPKLMKNDWLVAQDLPQRRAEYGSNGCSFYPRCPLAESICTKAKPPLESVFLDKEHLVACYFASPDGHTSSPSHVQNS